MSANYTDSRLAPKIRKPGSQTCKCQTDEAAAFIKLGNIRLQLLEGPLAAVRLGRLSCQGQLKSPSDDAWRSLEVFVAEAGPRSG